MARLAILGGLLLTVSALWAQAYRVESDRVRVEAEHWSEWNFPVNTLDFDASGVRSRFVRAQINAALDAPLFTSKDGTAGGVRVAGSNLPLAANIIDGSDDTFWEPAAGAPLRDWWIEINLGRSVWVRKIVVKFVEEGAGDPFLQFNVLTSSGLVAFSQSKVLSFERAGRSEGLNKSQRVFEFELQPTVNADEDFVGDVVQYIQIVATASDLGQAEQISESTWNSLPAGARGDVLYFRRELSGAQRQVDKSEYDAIAAGRRGQVRHYRRERPRLAEVEVWAAGDNISLDVLDRGGEIVGYGNLGAEVLTLDGDYTTFWAVEVGFSSLGFGGNILTDVVVQDPIREIFLDLGAWYWVDRLLFVFDKLSSGGAFPNYVVKLSDGTRAPDGSLIFTILGARGEDGLAEEENRGLYYQDNSFSLTRARFLQVDYRILQHSIRSGIREIQLYGKGFIPRVSMTSDMIELGRNPRILANISWDADLPAGTQLQIRTRTGSGTKDLIHYFNNTGGEVSEERYRKLASFQRGDSLTSVIPGDDWSNWSAFYQDSGALTTSPSPRRYAMIQATLFSDDPDQAVLLRNLQIDLETPLADRVLGEIAPRTVQHSGQREILNLYLQPTFRGGNRGFDQVLVELPPGVEVELLDVRVGVESEFEADGGRLYAVDEIERIESGADSLWLRLPEAVDVGSTDLIALRLSGSLFLASNAFTVSVAQDDGAERVWQRVDAGDVVAFARGRDLVVQTPFGGGLVGDVEVAPNPFTPNGDRINDQVQFSFPVFKVQGGKALILEVYDLSGRLVQRVEKTVDNVSGKQSVSWDGRDAGGELLPPGIYLCRVGLDVDDESAGRTMVAKLVNVAY